MKRCTALLLILFSAGSLSGCQWLRRFWLAPCVTLFGPGFLVSAGGSCAGEKSSAPLVTYPGKPKVVTVLDQAIARGATATPGPFDECRDFCADPQSDACDQCRSRVGIAVSQPYFNFCQGIVYKPMPAGMHVQVHVDTNIGTVQSPTYWVLKERGTVRYDNCGGENADYVLPESQVQSWATGMVDQGVRQVYQARLIRIGAGAEEPLAQLKDEYKDLEETQEEWDPRVWGVGFSAWLFGAAEAAGCITPILMPPDFSGPCVQSLKPCRDDNDCLGDTYCAADQYCR